MSTLTAWVSALPVAFIAGLVLFVPGLIVGVLARLRGLWLVATAPALSLGLIVVSATISPLVGLSWSVVPLAIATALTAGVVALVFRGASRGVLGGQRPAASEPPSWVHRVVPLAGLAAGVLFIAFVIVRIVPTPDALSILPAVWDVETTQHVLATANASPLNIGEFADRTIGLPGWPALVALVAQLSGASVAVATLVTAIVVASIVYVPGITLFARQFVPSPWLAAAIGAPLIAAVLPAFPFFPLHAGPAYAFLLAMALTPAIAAVVTRALRESAPATSVPEVLRLALIAAIMLAGAVGTAVSALPTAIVLVAPAVTAFAFARSDAPHPSRTRWFVGLGFAALVFAVMFVLRPTGAAALAGPSATMASSIGGVLTASVGYYPIAYGPAVLIALGLVVALRRPSVLGSMALALAVSASVLYCTAASSDQQWLRVWLTGSWGMNVTQLASLWAIAVVPLATLGLGAIVTWLAQLLERVPALRANAQLASLTLAVLLFVASPLLAYGTAIRQVGIDLHTVYTGTPVEAPAEIPAETPTEEPE